MRPSPDAAGTPWPARMSLACPAAHSGAPPAAQDLPTKKSKMTSDQNGVGPAVEIDEDLHSRCGAGAGRGRLAPRRLGRGERGRKETGKW